MLAQRGRPGSAEHAALRTRQGRDAARPAHHSLAGIVAARLATLPQDVGTTDAQHMVRPVEPEEARVTGVPDAWPIPAPIARVVWRATAGTIEQLIDQEVVASAEVLASLTPLIAAATYAAQYPEPSLRRLMATTFRAFRNRRSLLLLNLEHQVRLA